MTTTPAPNPESRAPLPGSYALRQLVICQLGERSVKLLPIPQPAVAKDWFATDLYLVQQPGPYVVIGARFESDAEMMQRARRRVEANGAIPVKLVAAGEFDHVANYARCAGYDPATSGTGVPACDPDGHR